MIAVVGHAAQGGYLDSRPPNAPHQKPAVGGQYRAPENKAKRHS